MPELLLELFSEEIPSRMQVRASEDLKRLMTESLKDKGLTFEAVTTYETPRRITLVVQGLPQKSPDIREERKGPKVGAPEKAVQGFMRAAGLNSIEDAKVCKDKKKGEYYLAVIEREGQIAEDIIAEIVPEIIRKFPWQKSMRWGEGRLRWVRPLHSILCVFDQKHIAFEVEGIQSGNITFGHRFMAPEPIIVKTFSEYHEKLGTAKVILSSAERATMILENAKALAQENGLQLVEDKALLAETAGLVEWPSVLMGTFDETFLDVPPEVLSTSMKSHQKCFSLKTKNGKLANKFLLVSNLIADDGGQKIINGNERVIRARLSDAKFFWDNDKTRPLADALPKLELVTFHEKLGTQAERIERIAKLSVEIAQDLYSNTPPTPNPSTPGGGEHKVSSQSSKMKNREQAAQSAPSTLMGEGWGGGDLNQVKDFVKQAAQLCKADLASEIVCEFPELQGLAGRYIALAQGHDERVANACAEHYKPQGPSDEVPTEPVSIAVGLADKIDMLVGFWAIDEKPTGSKDPFALRRAALGVIRIILENKLHISLFEFFSNSYQRVRQDLEKNRSRKDKATLNLDDREYIRVMDLDKLLKKLSKEKEDVTVQKTSDLLSFFADRLTVYLRDKGARYDLIDAIFALQNQDDLLAIVQRVNALGTFLETDNGMNLLAGIKRAVNILNIEEKKTGTLYHGDIKIDLLETPEEKILHKAILATQKSIEVALQSEQYKDAMIAMAQLREPVDSFFESVIVNVDNSKIRTNRLKLLSLIRTATHNIADFSKIEG
ncbi:MAG: glycine--tRNA ligase subunit beta [Pseudomonadota bacterium]